MHFQWKIHVQEWEFWEITIRKNEILDAEKIKNEVNSVKLEDVNNFAKTGYLTENITVLGNIKK